MKRYLKWTLALCAALVMMLGLLAGCGEKQEATTEQPELYWNIDTQTYLGVPGEVAVRRMEADGYYSVRFAVGGKQERIRVTQDVLKKGLDVNKIVALVLDENGVAVDFMTVDECTGGLLVEDFFVESIENNIVTCNSTYALDGYQKTFELTEDVQVYNVEGTGPLTGMKTELKREDQITAVLDKNGKVTHCFVKPLEDTPQIYFNRTRMYDSTAKVTTRETDLTGTYVFEMALNGETVTVKTKNSSVATAMDRISHRMMLLSFDEDGYVESAAAATTVMESWAGGGSIIGMDGNRLKIRLISSGAYQGMGFSEVMASNFAAYDVSLYTENFGAVTQVQPGDQAYCLKNSRGQVAVAFITRRPMPGDIYLNVKRMYNSETLETTRTPDADGWYELLMAKDGQQVTLKTQDREIVNKIDALYYRHCGLQVENGVIKMFMNTADMLSGYAWSNGCDVTAISKDGTWVQTLRNADGTNKGTSYSAELAPNCKVYDASSLATYVGGVTDLRVDDRICAVVNSEGKVAVIYVTRRLADSKMYWNVEPMFNDTTKQTTRSRGSDGYYRVTLAVGGKQVTYKVADKAVMNSIDSRPYACNFGIELEGNVITRIYEPSLVTGGGGWGAWTDITSIKNGVITTVKVNGSASMKAGTVCTAKMAEDCEVYDVSALAEIDSFIGVKTTPRVGDRVYGMLNTQGEIQVLYIVGNRLAKGCIVWNFNRMYDSENKVSTREPNADGWYKIDLAFNGKHAVWKTKDKSIVDNLDANYCSGLSVTSEGVIEKYYPYNLIYGGSGFGSWCDVTRLSGSSVTVKRVLSGSNQGQVYTAKRASTCKVYDVSENYVDHRGEETTLQVGDRILGIKNSKGDLRVIYVVWRPDRPGEPDHFHCTCGDGSFDGVGDHTCDDTTGWSAWTNPRKLPTSGNWYLDTDVNLATQLSIEAGATVNLCLNGHTVNGSDTVRIYYNSGNLTITDCKPAAQQGQMIGNADTSGSVLFNSDPEQGAVMNIFGGTYKTSLDEISKSGGVLFAGYTNKGPNTLNIYGGTIIGAKLTGESVGGALYVMAQSTVNVYGGTITGGSTNKDGGNLYVAEGTVNVYGGEIIGGSCTNEGGNIHVSQKAALNIYGGTIADGGVDGEGNVITRKGGNIQNFGALTIAGGEVSGGKAIVSGGNIGTYTNYADVTITGGTIADGNAPKGGNINVENKVTNELVKLTVSGGTISGAPITLAHGAATITGGTISGGLEFQGNSTIELSGTPVIFGNDVNLNLLKNEGITLGDFAEGAQIGVTVAETNVPFATLTDSADKAFFSSDDEDTVLEINAENQLYLRAKHTHCVCGNAAADGMGEHTCDDTRGWTKWTDGTTLPTTSGYYYLDTDVVLTTFSSQAAMADVYICFNGHTITGPSDNRVMYLRGNITFTDCKPVDEQGGIIAMSDVTGSVIYVDDAAGENPAESTVTIYGGTYENDLDSVSKIGGLFFLGNKDLGGTTTLNMYGGKIQGANNSANGGAIYAFRLATINMYGGIISGGKSASFGGNIYLGTGEVNLYGGTISGGEAEKGGNIYVADGQVNVSGATISGGYASADGGNVYMNKGALNVQSGLVTGGACANEGGNLFISQYSTMDMDGGQITNGGVDKENATVTQKGGNIQNFGVLTISGGQITGGKAVKSGGNIGTYTNNCDITISGGTISNGVAPKGGNINMENKTANKLVSLTVSGGAISGAPITLTHCAATVTDGTISGGLQVNGQSTLALSGKPVISGATVNLSVSDGSKITIGDLTEGASIGLTLANLSDFIGPLADPADAVYFESDSEDMGLYMDDENKIRVQLLGHRHCLCAGAPMATAASHSCTELLWTPISEALEAAGLTATTADLGKLESGNYYLDTDLVVTAASALKDKDVNICLNGHNITTDAKFTVAYGLRDGVLSITDCSYNAESKTWGGTVKGGTSTTGAILYATGRQTVNIYGGNFTAIDTETVAKSAGLFAIGQDSHDMTVADDKSVMNLYGGKIYGGQVSGNGGNIGLFHYGVLNMYGGEVTGGKAANGGNIQGGKNNVINIFGGTISDGTVSGTSPYQGGGISSAGTVNISGGTISANKAQKGGAVYSTGTLTITGGSFTGNRAYNEGGAIWASGTMSLANATISGNATTNTNTGMGGNIYVIDATVTMTSGTVTGGSAVDGGNIYIAGTAGTADEVNVFTISGGTVSNGQAVHTGYPNAKNGTTTIYPMGGNICLQAGEKLLITSGTVTNGTASHCGGNIAVNGSTLEVTGGSITGGLATNAGNIYTSSSTASQLIIRGGSITGGQLDTSKSSGTGPCIRLHKNVRMTISGSPVITRIDTTNAPAIDATGLNALETPIEVVVKSATAAFAEVVTDLSGSFTCTTGTIRYEAGADGESGKLFVDEG